MSKYADEPIKMPLVANVMIDIGVLNFFLNRRKSKMNIFINMNKNLKKNIE
jgi:hypothetical protein